jgi:hypothetical protein
MDIFALLKLFTDGGGEIPLQSHFLLHFAQIENIHSESASLKAKQIAFKHRFRISPHNLLLKTKKPSIKLDSFVFAEVGL